MKVVIEENCFEPKKAHQSDAGIDLRTPEDFEIKPRGSVNINTGIHVQLPRGTVGLLLSKSGLMVHHGIVTAGGVIDEGYTGSICVTLRNDSDKAYKFRSGDKITQLVILPVVHTDINVVDSLEDTERGANGFGSSGR